VLVPLYFEFIENLSVNGEVDSKCKKLAMEQFGLLSRHLLSGLRSTTPNLISLAGI
jgi:hypothetical protein